MRSPSALIAVVAGFLSALALLVAPTGSSAASAPRPAVENTAPPVVTGDAVYDELLTAGRGRWRPGDVEVAYRWLRDGAPVTGARERSYRVRLADLGHRLSVRVTATDPADPDGRPGFATSEPTARVQRADLGVRRDPAVRGEARYTRTVTARPGTYTAEPDRVEYRWLRDGRPIEGADRRRYAIAPGDVGRDLAVKVTAHAEGYRPVSSLSAPVEVRHRVDVRRTVTYHVETRGRITASLAQFRRQAQATYDDPRGWRAMGVRFRPVRSGGDFTLVLAEAARVPDFSPVCSAVYSCRVGRFVIINQTRWLNASPAWNAEGESLRDYRHMVVNHETGHWLGRGHASCPSPGALAPVMMQQSKGTQGCRLNPWPTAAELR